MDIPPVLLVRTIPVTNLHHLVHAWTVLLVSFLLYMMTFALIVLQGHIQDLLPQFVYNVQLERILVILQQFVLLV